MGRFGAQSRLLNLIASLAVGLALCGGVSWSQSRAKSKILTPPAKAEPEAEGPATFKSDVSLVRLMVSVKDPTGQPIGSLEKGDFRVFDSGVEQQISVFEHHSAVPLSISILIDISGSTARDLGYEVESIQRFLNALLREGNPDDAAALYSFNDEVNLLTSFTRREERLRDRLRSLKARSGTSLYDAVYLAAGDLDRREEGRHVMVVVTDGGDTSSSARFEEARRAAQYADTVIYPILVVPIKNDAGRNLGGERALELLARDTGGRVFQPSPGPDLDKAFADILRDLRTQYLVAYYPRNLPPEAPAFRRVRVELSRPDLRPETRAGYYGEAAK